MGKRGVPKFNKKAQDLSIGTLILIVLGIVVLVILILGFSIGWTNLFERIGLIGAGGVSLSDVSTRCQLAITSDNKFDYCQKTDKINVNKKAQFATCQHPNVEAGLDERITCPEIDDKDVRVSLCKQIVSQEKASAENKVTFNGREFASEEDCETGWAAAAAK